MFTKLLYQVAFCLIICAKARTSQASGPKLTMMTSFVNVTGQLKHGDHFGYVTTLKHTDQSQADAKGIHVTWMLAPYIKFRHLVDISLGLSPPRIVHKDDSVTLKLDTLSWGLEATISFKVQFDPEMILKPKYYDIVTPVQLLYYDDYSEDSDGKVVTKGNVYTHPLGKVAFDIELPGCSQPLGMKSGRIHDYQITASSSYDESQPSRARETKDAWCTDKENKDQYIQVDFLLKTRVSLVGTMRRKSKDHWVTKYFLQYSDDDVTWIDYLENGHVKMFKGPQSAEDRDMIVHKLRHPIEANSIRIRPWEFEELICVRFELYGCDIPGSPASCISPLGLESGEITDAALTHSLPDDNPSKPQFIRLNEDVNDYPFGWLSRSGEVPPDYLQIDFGSLRRVTRMSTMGGTLSFYFVKSYKLEYSLDGMTWVNYREKGQVKPLNGPKSSKEAAYAVLAKLAEPFVARYLRIIPEDKDMSMRAEIYGCFAEELPPYGGVPDYARRSFLLDPVTDRFYACMYTSELTESSCFSTEDGVEWTAVKPLIISVTASNPSLKEIYGLDRRMNFHRSFDSGESWRQITDGYLNKTLTETKLIKATALHENLVSEVPTVSLTAVANSTGTIWGVSGHGIHVMTAGSDAWSLVGTWKCCGQ